MSTLSATLRGLARGSDASGASSEACPGPQAPTWHADAPGETLAQLREIIGRFQTEIPGVVSVVEGASVSTEGLEAGYEWALVVTFESAGARDG